MRSSQSSLDTFNELGAAERRVVRREQVLDAFLNHGPTNDRAAAQIVGMPINCVVPRRAELEAEGRLVCLGRRQCQLSGRMTYFYAAVEAPRWTK